ncbi:hypothetical protein Sjap_002186 [Stephania japonica]|uniref:CSC1-like protein At3g54510 n=1 Tax=Stephania japonica TaxID=461633 RepID=A0AAP0PVV1_9MAGN
MSCEISISSSPSSSSSSVGVAAGPYQHSAANAKANAEMNAQALLASAGINIALAVVVLSLFSIFKKWRSNALIYYARPISKHDDPPLPPLHPSSASSSTISMLLPSFRWIPRALRVSEDQILQTRGLDALVVLRLFKFGYLRNSLITRFINLLSFSAVLGFPTLIAQSHDMEYNGILMRRIQHLHKVRHRPDQFTILVREIPPSSEHISYGACVDHFFSKHHPHTYQSSQIIYDGKIIEDLLQDAVSTERKIQHMIQKQGSGSKFFNLFSKSIEEIEAYEEKLQQLCHTIRHLQCKNILKEKELPVAFVSFKTRQGATIAYQSQQHDNPLIWVTEMAPEPRDVLWKNLSVPHCYFLLHKIGVFLGASLLTIFFAIPVAAVQGIAQFEKLKKWFPPAMAVQLIPGLRSIVTGYLPSAILNTFIYIVPFAMVAMGRSQGFFSRCKGDIKACSMVFYFLVGNVFFLSLLSGSLLHQIGESFAHPRDFPRHLAAAVSAQADFFITYILTDGLSLFSLEILQAGLLIWDFIRANTFGRGQNENPYLFSLPYYRVIPFVSVSILIGMVYAVIAPLLLPFLVVYLFLGYVVYVNQIQDVYDTTYETCGQYWPYIHHYITIAIILMQITMIGLFGLKSKPAASISTLPFLLLTILFNEYCKMRFCPTFFNNSIQNAVKNDQLDEKDISAEECGESAISAYVQPCLRPLSFSCHESSSTQPLVVSA